MQHHAVKHPSNLLQEAKADTNRLVHWNDAFAEWVTEHVLASLVMFDIAIVIPLLLWNAPDNVKLVLAMFSGSWIQWWALPALQRSQNKIQAHQEAKAEVDHRTLVYLAKLQDEQMAELKFQTELMKMGQEERRALLDLAARLHQEGGDNNKQAIPPAGADSGAPSNV